MEYGFKQTLANHSLFYKWYGTNILVYIDEMIATSTNTWWDQKVTSYLTIDFEMKDLKNVKYFLSIEVSRFKLGFFLSQHIYGLDILDETNNSTCAPVDTYVD